MIERIVNDEDKLPDIEASLDVVSPFPAWFLDRSGGQEVA